MFFRESCFRQSGDVKRSSNPTHYRNPRDYFAIFDGVEVGLQRIATGVAPHMLLIRGLVLVMLLLTKFLGSGPHPGRQAKGAFIVRMSHNICLSQGRNAHVVGPTAVRALRTL